MIIVASHFPGQQVVVLFPMNWVISPTSQSSSQPIRHSLSESKDEQGSFHPDSLREITDKWQTAMPQFDGWNTVYLDTHDSRRSLSRYASDKPEYRAYAAKMLSMYMCSLSGSLFLLQGQEIGMTNAPEEWDIETTLT